MIHYRISLQHLILLIMKFYSIISIMYLALLILKYLGSDHTKKIDCKLSLVLYIGQFFLISSASYEHLSFSIIRLRTWDYWLTLSSIFGILNSLKTFPLIEILGSELLINLITLFWVTWSFSLKALLRLNYQEEHE